MTASSDESMAAPPLRLGLIGYGGYGTFLARTWESVLGARVTALAGRHSEAACAAARSLGIPQVFTGDDAADQLMRDPDLDALVITSPPSDHARMALAALEAGKHVYCEKPLATTVADAERVRDAVRRTGKRLAMGYVLRYDPLFERLKRLVDSRVFGELHRIDFENFAGDEHLPPDHWFWDVSRSGGILIEHGVHFFDIYSWLVGAAPRRVTGHRTRRAGTTQEDRVSATVEYENGCLASFYHAFDKPSRLERTTARLAFDRGYVEVDGWIALSLRFDAALEPDGRATLNELLPGWVEEASTAYAAGEQAARGAGHEYTLVERTRGAWTLSTDKQAVYEECARASLRDFLTAIADPKHIIRADVETGLAAVRIAAAIPPPAAG